MYNIAPRARFSSSVGNGLFNSASLDLHFAKTKSLVDATTGQNLVTFTRASSGTYVDSQGVIQMATTNLLRTSEEFNDASWPLINATVTPNQAIAPNGTVTADRFVETIAGTARLSQTVLAIPGATYTASIYLKAGTNSNVFWREDAEDIHGIGVNLATGTITSGSGTITPVGDDWYRVSFAGSVSGTSFRPEIRTASQPGTIFLWGAQLEQSSTVGEYIPTTSTINSAPRFDHNPTTGESLGLLVEEQRTNVVTWSQDFSQADWSKASSTVVATTVASPIQGVNYQKIEATSANTTVGITSVAVTAATQQRAVSFFAQPLGNISRVLVVVQGADARINVNLADGTFTTNAAATGSTVSVSGQRFSVSTPTLTNATGVRFFLKRTGETDTNTPTTIAIGEGLYLIGAQMEVGAFPTSYIPTTTATVTRSADVASITGSNFSSWYRQDEGTVFVEYRRLVNASGRIFTFNDTTANEQIRITASQSANIRPDWQVIDGGFVQANVLGAAEIAVNSTGKSAGAYKVNDFQQATNSFLGTADTTGTLPTISVLNIGANESGSGSIINGTIRRLTYWPTRLSNATLQQITQ